MSPKNYLRLLQGGLILSLFFVLFVFTGLLFPYITSKQLPFNMLMEVLLAFWLVFIWRYPTFRPKLNLMIYSLMAYFAVILASCFTGVDFNLSFWGDVERMLGFFHIFHFFIFFLILISVFRTWSEWRALLISSVGVATVVSLIGLLGAHEYSTIGNTAYVSGYLIFNFFFAAILFLRTNSKWRFAYLIPFLIMLFQFKNMHTSGAIIGFAASLFLIMILVGILHSQKKVRIQLLSISALLIIIVVLTFSQQNSAWFQKSFLKNLTSQKTTFQTRLLSWKGAARDFKYHPILGTGFGNYAIIFDRQFDPIFFNYDKVETYFDRAHNNLIDITSTTGVAGLITYLSIFIFALIYLIKKLKVNAWKINGEENGKRNLEIVFVLALMAAYFIQNLAVFDSLVTYVGLMIMLGFVYWLPKEKALDAEDTIIETSGWLQNNNRELLALVVLLVIATTVVFKYNIGPWKMLTGSINGYTNIMVGRSAEGFDIFRSALSGTPLDRDGRSTLINLVLGNPDTLTVLPADTLKLDYDYIVSLAQQNLQYNEHDSLFQLQMAQVYDLGARLFYKDKEQRAYYSNLSVESADKAIAASPGRIPGYFVKAQALLVQEKTDEAVAILSYAASLNPSYSQSYCRLAQVYMMSDKTDNLGEALNKCVDGGDVNQLGSGNSLISAASYFADKGDYPRAILVVERLSAVYKDNAEVWFNLAKLYFLNDEVDKARVAADKSLSLDKTFQGQIDQLFSK